MVADTSTMGVERIVMGYVIGKTTIMSVAGRLDVGKGVEIEPIKAYMKLK